jgi:hypothetical protein
VITAAMFTTACASNPASQVRHSALEITTPSSVSE